MSDHLSLEALQAYRRRSLKPAELLALDDHLAGCSSCRQLARSATGADRAVARLETAITATQAVQTEHLPDLQLRQYTRGALNPVDRELAEHHLKLCGECSARERSYRERHGATARSFWKLPRWFAPPAAAIAAALVLILAIGGFVWLKQRPDAAGVARQDVNVPPDPTPPGIVLKDGGHLIQIKANGDLSGAPPVTDADRDSFRLMLASQKVDAPAGLQELRGSASQMMGGKTDGGFVLLQPVGRVIPAGRPRFAWRAAPGATAYEVTVASLSDDYRVAAVSPEVYGTTWTPDRPLAPGSVYSWQVTARTPAGEIKAPAPNQREARFRTLARAELARLETARQQYAGSHLLLGLTYAGLGMLEEAEAEFQALAQANPDSAAAQNLLSSLRALRR